MDPRLHIFGIRHHGPGSAASVVRALDDVGPGMVLVEGPPEASEILPLAAASGMRPPVAILTYPKNQPEHAHFYPYAEYSPEWQAICWAVRNDRPVRCIDAPMMAPPPEAEAKETDPESIENAEEGESVDPDDIDDSETSTDLEDDPVLRDPLSYLARAAGHSDGEAWWNALIEQHVHAPDIFEAIETAMAALREEGVDADRDDAYLEREAVREAHMRLAIRKALKETEEPVAVVCGAWHAPALREKISMSADRATVKGMRGVKAECCWVPWTDTRLAAASGYGAGVISPAWYRHLWSQFKSEQDRTGAVAQWQSRAARLLRDEGLPASPSSVIEATRLATTLAAVRGLPVPGLSEMRDASLSALCHGDELPLKIIDRRLVIGISVGEVDENAPQPPLLADLTRQQKKLRLKPEALEREIDVDLRSNSGLQKSILLHRLRLLRVHWGQLLELDERKKKGTFKERWRLEWTPELSVALAEAVIHGPTVERAANGAALANGREAADCGVLADIVRQCLLANLAGAASQNIRLLQAAAIHVPNVFSLAKAVVPLVDVLRYGTAREMPEKELQQLVTTLMVEICAGLRHGCHGLDEDLASDYRKDLASLNRAIGLLEDETIAAHWVDALTRVAKDDLAASQLRGYATRLLYDRGAFSPDETSGYLSRGLSPAVPLVDAGAWFEGFMSESGEILLADDELFTLVDSWICAQKEEAFIEILPILRRALSSFDSGSSRRLLDRVGRGASSVAAVVVDDPRAAAAFARAAPLLKDILGIGTK